MSIKYVNSKNELKIYAKKLGITRAVITPLKTGGFSIDKLFIGKRRVYL